MTTDRHAPHLSVAQLSAITGNVGELTSGQIHDASDSFGILLSGSIPAGWTRWLNLVDTGSPFLKHDNLELAWDGSATFSGEVASDNFTALNATFRGVVRAEREASPSVGSESTDLGDANVRFRRWSGTSWDIEAQIDLDLNTSELTYSTVAGGHDHVFSTPSGKALIVHSDGPLSIEDGISAPSARSGRAQIYVDSADGNLKVKFGDGTTKIIQTDT